MRGVGLEDGWSVGRLVGFFFLQKHIVATLGKENTF